MGLISKAFSDIITFSRASNATRVGPDGTVQYAPHNLATYSEQFDNAAWSKLNTTVTANAVASPNGTVTADKIVETATSAAFLVYQTGVASGGTYTLSIYAKAAERSKFALEFASVGYEAVFDLSAGTVYSTTSSTAAITSVGNGWYRCSATAAIASSSTVAIGIRDASGNRSYAGTAGYGVYLWGAQLSQGSIAGDYTPTTSAAVYGPRFDYDPVTLAAKGLLIEEQRTNLNTYSEAFDNVAWTAAAASISANAAVAPDGTSTADSLIENSATANHYVSRSLVVSSATAYTYSVYVKAKGRSIIFLNAYDTQQRRAWFNLSTGTVGTADAGVTGAISAANNGWYRVSITWTTTATTIYPAIELTSADGNSSGYAGDGSSGIHLWGAQVEAGAFATSYIPTVASTVTRSADVASVNTLSPWFNATEGTLYGEIIPASDIATIMSINASADSPNEYSNMHALRTPSGTQFQTAAGGVNQVLMGTYTIPVRAVSKMAYAYKANDFAGSANGATVVTDTSGSLPTTINQMFIGKLSTSVPQIANGHIRRIAYYPRRLTNTELQALTA